MNDNVMEAKEFSDKTVDKAIKAACDHFKCDKDDLDIVIITRGSTGLFGLGGRKAKITAKPLRKALPEENRPREEATQEAPAGETPQEGANAPAEKKGPVSAESEPQNHKEKQERQPARAEEKRESQAEKRPRKPRKEEVPPELVEKQLAAACDITNEILKKSGLEGEANTVEQSSRPFVNISGNDLSLIIGKEGKTLDALEYIVNLCLKRRDSDINYRVPLDAGGYRERRRKSLVSLAEKMAQKAKKTGKAVSLQPMPARERRIVHIALRSTKGIKTHSSGEGGGRKVVITPSRKRKRPARNRNNSK